MSAMPPYATPPDSVKVEQSPFRSFAPISSTSPSAAPPVIAPAAPAAAKPKNKPRKRVNTAEKRHQHNAVERQRREMLNGKFIVLARLLPGLATHRRPSKSAIVNNSISHLTKQREQRLLASRLLRQLCNERDALAKECSDWRRTAGIRGTDPSAPSAWSDEMEEVCSVEKEQFGTWSTMQDGDGDDDADIPEDGEGEGEFEGFEGGEMAIEQANAAVAGFNASNLITPRSSADMGDISFALGSSLPQILVNQTQSQALPISWPANFGLPTPTHLGMSIPAQHTDSSSVPSLSGSTGHLPFSAFMSDSLDSLSSSPSGSMHGIPTPPITSSDFARTFTHTPSPRSSGSFDDGSHLSHSMSMSMSMSLPKQNTAVPAVPLHIQQQHQRQLAQQQLLLQHTLEQQQLRNKQQAEMQSRQATHAAATSGMNIPLPLPSPTVYTGLTPTTAVPALPNLSPRNSMFPNDPLSIHTLFQQHQQQNPMNALAGHGLQMNMHPSVNAGSMSPSDMEDWRQFAAGAAGSTGPSSSSSSSAGMAINMGLGMGMGMGAWTPVQG